METGPGHLTTKGWTGEQPGSPELPSSLMNTLRTATLSGLWVKPPEAIEGSCSRLQARQMKLK